MAKQTRFQSLIEVCISVAIGFLVALVLQVSLAWSYNKPFTLWENISWTAIFTVASIIRGYYVRRLFNWWHHRD